MSNKYRWRCFHCDAVFSRPDEAALHFGKRLDQVAACQLKAHEGHILKALRKAETELERYHSEDTDLHRSIYALQAEFNVAVRQAEEEGYRKGLRDGRELPKEAA